jgi:hypothetical protein
MQDLLHFCLRLRIGHSKAAGGNTVLKPVFYCGLVLVSEQLITV